MTGALVVVALVALILFAGLMLLLAARESWRDR